MSGPEISDSEQRARLNFRSGQSHRQGIGTRPNVTVPARRKLYSTRPLKIGTESRPCWAAATTTTIEEHDDSQTNNATMNKQDPAESFFEVEKQRLIGEINSVGFLQLAFSACELTSGFRGRPLAHERAEPQARGGRRRWQGVQHRRRALVFLPRHCERQGCEFYIHVETDRQNESYEAAVPGTGTTNFGASTQR